MRHPLGSRLAATAIAGVAVLALGAPAYAQTAADGLWYFDVLNVQDAHDAGWTGEGATIAVLDSPINPDIPTLEDADLWIDEMPACYFDGEPMPPVTTAASAQHGTNVVSMIVGSGAEGGVKGVAPGASILYYPVSGPRDENDSNPCFDSDGEPTFAPIARAIDDAVDRGADIISVSLLFPFGDGVLEAVSRALHHEVILVTGLGNQQGGDAVAEAMQFSGYLNGGVSVQAVDRNGEVQTHLDLLGNPTPNLDSNVDVAAPGMMILQQGDGAGDWSRQSFADGTSFATPIVAGFLAATAQKWPEATPNQLIQSLIHNTGAGDHELTYDENEMFGYGFASLTHMLRVDPTKYEDVNPLLEADGSPTPEYIEHVAASETPQTPEAVETPSAGGALLTLVLIPIAALVVLAAIVVVIIVLVRRRARH